MMNSQHAQVADIPMNEMLEVRREVLHNMRASIKGNKRSADDILNSYVQENQGKFVVVRYGEAAGLSAAFSDGTLVGKNTTKAEVMGRVEHGVVMGQIDFYIEERLLRSYCSNMSFSYNTFKQQLSETFSVSHVQRKDMLAKTDGPPMRVPAVKISRNINEVDDVLLQPLVPLASSQ